MPSNTAEYDQRYWLEHGHRRTLKARLAELEAECEELREAGLQMASELGTYAVEIKRLRAALEGVIAEADRKTVAFDRARAALGQTGISERSL